MKANRKRIKLMRSVAIASCVAGLAAPSMAGAMPLPPDPHSSSSNPASASTAPITGGRTIAVSHENGATVRVVKPTNFGADSVSSQSKTISSASGPAMTPAGSKYANAWAAYTRNQSSAAYVLPATHTTDVQSSPPGSTPVAAPSEVVREVHTVTNDNEHTLAIVLASAALGIALLGTGYALTRVALVQRRMIGSSS
jgi:hypothetical protein